MVWPWPPDIAWTMMGCPDDVMSCPPLTWTISGCPWTYSQTQTVVTGVLFFLVGVARPHNSSTLWNADSAATADIHLHLFKSTGLFMMLPSHWFASTSVSIQIIHFASIGEQDTAMDGWKAAPTAKRCYKRQLDVVMWQPVDNISGSMPSKVGSSAATSQLTFILLFVKAKGTAQLRHEVVASQQWTQVDTTHCAKEHAVQGSCSTCQESGRWTKTGQRWVVRQPSLPHANSLAATLSGHWHRPAVTPLPGVSAPAGLRPSPPEPLFAAAQPSLCPVSAGKAGTIQYILREISRQWDQVESHGRKPIHTLEPEICEPQDRGCC